MSVIDVPPPIGSPAWDAELLALGWTRAEVDQELREYDGDPGSLSDPAAFLLHQQQPSYSALSPVYMYWNYDDPTDAERDWTIRQYAAIFVHGTAAVIDRSQAGRAARLRRAPESGGGRTQSGLADRASPAGPRLRTRSRRLRSFHSLGDQPWFVASNAAFLADARPDAS